MTKVTTTIAGRHKRYERRGAGYLLALGTATMLAVIGFSVITTARINTRVLTGANDWVEAGDLAFSAVEFAVNALNKESEWRTVMASGVPSPEVPFGSGSMSWVLVDEVDGDLADDLADRVRLYGIGRVGEATRVYSVLLQQQGSTPLDVLRTTVHAERALTITSSSTLNAVGGPASSNVLVWNFGTINGDAEAPAFAGSGGTITGAQTITEAKTMPSDSVFDTVAARATEIPWNSFDFGGGKLEGAVLSAAVNPTGGPTNPSGIYHVHVPSWGQLKVRVHRIRGTLVVRAEPGVKVKFINAILWEPHSPEYPILIVKGDDVEVDIMSPPTDLVESILGVNLNPPGTPYNGDEDNSTDDTYPSELRGLIHIIQGTLSTTHIANDVKIKGTVIGHGMIDVGNTLNTSGATIIHDPVIFANPPEGYRTPGNHVGLVQGTWQWDAVP